MNTQNQDSAWSQMYRKGDLDALIKGALPLLGTDDSAIRWFVRIFAVGCNMYRISPETVDGIRDYADQGNPYAQFAMARYLVTTQPDDNPDCRAKQYLEMVHKQGLPEATAAVAQSLHYGDFGPMNWNLGHKMLKYAIDQGCEFAFQYFTQEIIYGLHGLPENPAQALQFCDIFIEKKRDEYGEPEVDPRWYYLKGCAEQALYGWSRGLESFRKAADKGYVNAYPDVALALSHNDDGMMVDEVAWLSGIKRGAQHDNAYCMYQLGSALWDKLENLPEEERNDAFDEALTLWYEADKLGCGEASDKIADMLAERDDMEKAFQYYCRGAVFNNASCCEKAFAMMFDGIIDKPIHFRDFVSLRGARLDSELLIDEVVRAYRAGRMERYASEIEEHYIPVVEGEIDNGNESDDDEGPDDDGRFDAYA